MLIFSLALLAALLVLFIVSDLRSLSRLPVLRPVPGSSCTPVSVIVPARNEAMRIERLLRSLTQQTACDYELIVLDDRSEDDTAEIVRAYAPALPGLRLLAGETLPPGWAGKCWACRQAAAAASHGWLLFLDADTEPAPELIVTLLARAKEHRLDFLSVLPFLELHSFSERLLLPPFVALAQVVFQWREVNDPRSRVAFANGQCILVRREVYAATGGHAAVRDSVLEDIRLAQVVKDAGYRIELVAAPELLRVRMYTRFAEVAEGLRKNAWAGYSAGGWRSAWGGFRQALLVLAPLLLLAAGLTATIGDYAFGQVLVPSGLLLVALTATYWGWRARRLHALHPAWGLLFPLGTLAYFALAGLAWLDIRRGAGVRWKGRTYSR